MTTTAGSAVFLDANILVYSTFDHVEWHVNLKKRKFTYAKDCCPATRRRRRDRHLTDDPKWPTSG
jgi:hypothetical protein